MLVTPLPGVDRKHLHETLGQVCEKVSNLYGGGPYDHYERLLAYLDWATDAVDRLGRLISSADLDRLVLTKRHEQLLAGVAHFDTKKVERFVNLMVSAELRERTDAFATAVATLGQELQRWQLRGLPVVADTSFYIRHPDQLDDADLPALVGVEGRSIHLVVPMVVVDELDRLKEIKDPHVRWRARYTLAVLDRLFQTSMEQAVLHAPDPEVQRKTGNRHGEVTVQLMFDPPGHVRQSIDDDEIVDRALAIKPLAGREVTVLTYDTGQSTRARAVGLRDVKLRIPLGDKPEEQVNNKKKPRSSGQGIQAPAGRTGGKEASSASGSA